MGNWPTRSVFRFFPLCFIASKSVFSSSSSSEEGGHDLGVVLLALLDRGSGDGAAPGQDAHSQDQLRQKRIWMISILCLCLWVFLFSFSSFLFWPLNCWISLLWLSSHHIPSFPVGFENNKSFPLFLGHWLTVLNVAFFHFPPVFPSVVLIVCHSDYLPWETLTFSTHPTGYSSQDIFHSLSDTKVTIYLDLLFNPQGVHIVLWPLPISSALTPLSWVFIVRPAYRVAYNSTFSKR